MKFFNLPGRHNDLRRKVIEMLKKIEKTYFRYRGSLLPNALALLYCHLAYFGGLALILSLNPVLMTVGTLAMAHGMVIAAYMIHDCGHNAIFKSARHNAVLGKALNCLTGGCYGGYEDLRIKHMAHHVDNADVIELDYRDYLIRHPAQRKVVEALEWLYVPAVEFIMHGALMLMPFVSVDKKEQRARTVVIIAIRSGLLLALFLYSPIVFICYLLAYTLFITILRFMDALQHNYGTIVGFDSDVELARRRGDRDYEQSHTFSNPISIKHPWLNLLTLNFGYHNAHHSRPIAPWHQLPKLHRSLHGDKAAFVIPFRKQLASFHRGRAMRVMGDESETQGNCFTQRLQKGEAVGANGVSFLTPI